MKSTLKAEIVFYQGNERKIRHNIQDKKKGIKPSVSLCSNLVTILMSGVTVKEMTRKSDDIYSVKARKVQILYTKLEVSKG